MLRPVKAGIERRKVDGGVVLRLIMLVNGKEIC